MKIKLTALMMGLLLLISGCSTSKSIEEEKEEELFVSVSVASIQKTRIERAQALTGKASPDKNINVVPNMPGKVKELYVKIGDNVNKGQTLFTIDDKDIRLQLNQAQTALNIAKLNVERSSGGSQELQLAQLESAVKTAEINLNDAKTMYEDTKVLYEGGMTSKQNMDAAQTRYKVAQEQYNQAKKSKEVTESKITKENQSAAKAQLEQARASYELANSQLKNTVVTSPIDGIIVTLNAEEGTMVSSAMAAATIVDISTINVDVNVLEDIVNKIKVGDSHDIFIKTVRDEPFNGEVISISPSADARTQTYPVKIKIPNPDGLIKGGMIAELKFVTEYADDVIAVPIEAVVDEGGKKYVYTVLNERAIANEVTLGMMSEKLVEIKGQINEGDMVIVKGQNFVKNQTKVKVVE